MLSKADKYQQLIQYSTQRIILFPNMSNQGKNPNVKLQCNIKLPSLHPFRSSQEIEKNIPITENIIEQSSQQQPISLQNHWPKSCIGLILCEHHQDNQTYYVYGTGILIHKSIVLTSAQNVYCRRLNTQYTNFRFVVGVSFDKCSGIYDIMRVHYPKEYTQQEEDDYNFAVLQLYDDLSNSCGYVGWKTMEDIQEDEKYTEYRYTSAKERSFYLRQIIKHEKQQCDWKEYSGSGVFIKENENNYIIVGLRQSARKIVLSDKIRKKINQWTELTQINIDNKQISLQACIYLSQTNFTNLTSISFRSNDIRTEGCKYLSQAYWTYLVKIYLNNNKIDTQACKYLSQTKWIHLTTIGLDKNNINEQGCKHLSQANWIHLTQFYLYDNKIDAQGCKYLSRTNWIYLNTINLSKNRIGVLGCKYLSQANWKYLNTIRLHGNKIGAQGCKYLSQANWIYLNNISLGENNICVQGCKYLSQANWIYLTSINLCNNIILL